MNDIESWRVFLPYYADRVEDNTYILLGRNHEPLGLEKGSKRKHPIVYVVKGLTPQMAAQISCRRDPDIERIYFYNGNCRLGAVKSISMRMTSESGSFWGLRAA
jgi:hypothetical protein